MLRDLSVKFQGGTGASANLSNVFNFEHRIARRVQIHHFHRTVQEPLPRDAHLLPRDAGNTHFTLQPAMCFLAVGMLRLCCT